MNIKFENLNLSEFVEIVAEAVATKLNSGDDKIKIEVAKNILGVGERQILNLTKTYPELKPYGKNSHFYSRMACVRIAGLRRK